MVARSIPAESCYAVLAAAGPATPAASALTRSRPIWRRSKGPWSGVARSPRATLESASTACPVDFFASVTHAICFCFPLSCGELRRRGRGPKSMRCESRARKAATATLREQLLSRSSAVYDDVAPQIREAHEVRMSGCQPGCCPSFELNDDLVSPGRLHRTPAALAIGALCRTMVCERSGPTET